MRRSDKSITDKIEIKEILTNSFICNVGIFDDIYPYVVSMNYGYKDNCLYFHCAPKGKKIDLIEKNNRVGFEITHSEELVTGDIACKWTTKYSSIMGQGSIDIIADREGKISGLDVIMKQHGKNDNSYSDKMIDAVLVLKLNIENLTAKRS